MTNAQAHTIAYFPLAQEEIIWSLAASLNKEPVFFGVWSNPITAPRLLLGIGHTKEEAWADASTTISKMFK